MNRNPLIALALAVLLLLGLSGAYVFEYHAFGVERAKATKLEDSIAQKSAEFDRLANAKRTLSSLSNDEATIQQYFVSESDIVPFLGGLESTGTSLGSNVQVVSVTPDDASGPRGHLALAVRIDGSFDAVMRTLGAIEYAPYDIALTGVTLDSQGAPNGKGPNQWSAAATFALGTHAATSTP